MMMLTNSDDDRYFSIYQLMKIMDFCRW